MCSAHFVIGDGAVVIICAYAPGDYAASQAKKISEVEGKYIFYSKSNFSCVVKSAHF